MRTQKTGWASLLNAPGLRSGRGFRQIPRQLRPQNAEPHTAESPGSGAGPGAEALADPGRVEVRTVDGHELACRIQSRPSIPHRRRRNLALLADALDAAAVPYFLVPGFSIRRHRVGVLERHRDEVFRALADRHADGPVYLVRMAGSGAAVRDLALASDGAHPGRVEEHGAGAGTEGGWAWWRLVEPVQTPDGTLTLGIAYGADLEFWTERPDGGWQAPRRNRVTPTLARHDRRETTTAISGRSYPTFAPLTMPTVETITFPIDAVYTYVDESDPQWRADRRAALASADQASLATIPNTGGQSMCFDELRYALRSLEQHAEWVRHVWVVTEGHVPPWLDAGHERVTVLPHRDIWHPDGDLPAFNRLAVEANLHRIPGLAEHYVYFGDGVLLGRPVGPELFFHPNGLTKFCTSGTTAARPADRDLIEHSFGRTVTQRTDHAPQALRRSVAAEMEMKWPEAFRDTSRSTFRRDGDVAASGSLHHWYAYCTGRATRSSMRQASVSLSRPDLAEELGRLLGSRDVDAFRFADTCLTADPAAIDRKVTTFLDRYFPTPSAFERP